LTELVGPLGDAARAEDAYRRLVAIDPFDREAEAQLGRLALKRKDAVTAVRSFKSVLGSNPPDRAQAHVELAEAHLAAGQYGEAKKQTLAALEIAPSFERIAGRPGMREAILVALLGVAVACSDRSKQQTGPSTIPPSSRVVVSGTVFAAENGAPIPKVLVEVVEGVNAGRNTFSEDGTYQLADLEPGRFTLQFTTSEYRDLLRTEVVQGNTTVNVQLERKGLTLSGRIATQWGEPIGDVGVEVLRDGRVQGGGSSNSGGLYRIPTLPAGDYIVRPVKHGYLTPTRTLTLTGDTTFDMAFERVRVSLFGTVREVAPCAGAVPDARVEIVSGPDAGVGVTTTASGYQTTRSLNWGRFTLRVTKTGYVPVEVSLDVVPPGSSCQIQMPNCPYVTAPSDVQQDFLLQRTGSC
jgi:hypothetical protein